MKSGLYRKSFFLFVISLALLSGCTVIHKDYEAEENLLAQFESPPKGRAGLYIYRNVCENGRTVYNAASGTTIYVNGIKFGDTTDKVYIYKSIPAGRYVISSNNELEQNILQIKLEAGKNYFIEQDVKLIDSPREIDGPDPEKLNLAWELVNLNMTRRNESIFWVPDLKVVDDEIGKRTIFNCERVMRCSKDDFRCSPE